MANRPERRSIVPIYETLVKRPDASRTAQNGFMPQGIFCLCGESGLLKRGKTPALNGSPCGQFKDGDDGNR